MDRIEGILTIVAESLRDKFPDDFYKRCGYAAWAVRALLIDEDAEAELVGGNFVAFVVSPSTGQVGLQGFGYNPSQCAHFWVESMRRIIDLGPYVLPFGSSFSVLPMPAVAWRMDHSLPKYLRYQTLQRFPSHAVMSPDPIINERCRQFIESCRTKWNQNKARNHFPTWLLSSPAALQRAINRRDGWARNALLFERRLALHELPF